MNRFDLNMHIGENALVQVSFDLISDGDDDYDIDWNTVEVWYNGIDIIDTLDQHDMDSIDKQMKEQWDEIEKQIHEGEY